MIFTVQINNHAFEIDLAKPMDISIPLNFGGEQPNAFDVERAVSSPYKTDNLIGDTRSGGSCNFEQVTFIPHCNGTHTEGTGHLTLERISVLCSLKDVLIPATLITVEPENFDNTYDKYSVQLNSEDKLITKKSLENALEKIDDNWLRGLIIRTLPNDENKKTRNYMENLPPFFSTEAIKFIVERNVNHLLVDMPSIDKTFDEGKLSNHRIFWNIGLEEFATNQNSRFNNTITEMIFVPESVVDGKYLLNLQLAPFNSDASPSRPVLFGFRQL